MEKLKSSDPRKYNMYKMIKHRRDIETANLEYKLIFHKNKATFEVIEQLKVDGSKYSGIAMGPTNGVYYSNSNNCENLWQTDIYFNKRLIIILNKKSWNLEKETKVINGLLCRKAVGTFQKGSSENQTVEAWYAPEIPVSFGPLGFSGLPGLIVELKTEIEYYYMTEIILEQEDRVQIQRPLKGEEVTYNEFMLMAKEGVNRLR